MSNRSNTAGDSASVPRPKNGQEPQPVIVVLLVTLLASLVVMCAVLIIPIAWVAVTESGQRPRPIYQQCSRIPEEANRLACYDEVSRLISQRAANDARRMTFGELLGTQRSDQARPAQK